VEARVNKLHFLPILLLAASIPGLFAQHRVNPRNMYERLYLVVPMIGSGTTEDPRRPMYAPLPGEQAPDGIVAFTFQESDDGQFALVEFVARDRAAFKAIFNDHHPQVKIFQRGKDRRDDVQREFRKHKRNFDLDSLDVVVP
jgi:hypothetical protein